MLAQVTRQLVGHRAVVAVSGEIDIATVGSLAQSVDGLLDDGAAEVWIDLSRTDFMDSSGIHLMLETERRLAGLNRRMAIICPRGQIRRVFEVSGTAGVLPMFEDRTSAHQAG
jgi:anti-sigma B factor antagonist